MNRIVKKDTDSDGVEINIMYVFGLLIRRLWLLMLVGLIVGASCAGITKLVEEPTYTSSMTFIVNNKSEKLCRDKLEKRIASQPEGEKDYEVYIASQKEMCLLPSGKRKQVDRIVFRSIVFIRCTDVLRRKEIVHLPYIKRFMVNIAGERSGGIRPVAFIPDEQMVKLRRMLDDSEEPVIIDPRPLPLGARVRINGGKLHGLEGNVLEVEDGNLNFVIRVDLLGCAKVNITRDLLELL